MTQDIEKKIKEILKPFVYEKYGKVYIGYKETEGALRVEGLILQLEQKLKQHKEELLKEVEEELEIQKKVDEKAKEIVVVGRKKVNEMLKDMYIRKGKIEILEEIKTLIKK